MARKAQRYKCIRNVEVNGRLYKYGQVYEFSNSPPVGRYFKLITPVKKKPVKDKEE